MGSWITPIIRESSLGGDGTVRHSRKYAHPSIRSNLVTTSVVAITTLVLPTRRRTGKAHALHHYPEGIKGSAATVCIRDLP